MCNFIIIKLTELNLVQIYTLCSTSYYKIKEQLLSAFTLYLASYFLLNKLLRFLVGPRLVFIGAAVGGGAKAVSSPSPFLFPESI